MNNLSPPVGRAGRLPGGCNLCCPASLPFNYNGMKLRIQGNSIRLRLSQGEVQAFGETGKVEDSIAFGTSPGQRITYVLELGSIEKPTADFTGNQIKVSLPNKMGLAWATTDEVGIDFDMAIEDGHVLRILVEKDFKCLTDRAGEDESDNFPNPHLQC
ncbi:MAG: hypothetical protein H6577_04965 [Lewinellaceae bacterium]|nr:hypothetical protein [Saprospiraceae bacterium]MCB9337455.1 hypothetical protein [Lewinellaceae bacterium]